MAANSKELSQSITGNLEAGIDLHRNLAGGDLTRSHFSKTNDNPRQQRRLLCRRQWKRWHRFSYRSGNLMRAYLIICFFSLGSLETQPPTGIRFLCL